MFGFDWTGDGSVDFVDDLITLSMLGALDGEASDVDDEEDSNAQVDMNFIMTESGKIIEIQGTAEGEPFSEEDFSKLLALAKKSIRELIAKQHEVLGV